MLFPSMENSIFFWRILSELCCCCSVSQNSYSYICHMHKPTSFPWFISSTCFCIIQRWGAQLSSDLLVPPLHMEHVSTLIFIILLDYKFIIGSKIYNQIELNLYTLSWTHCNSYFQLQKKLEQDLHLALV